MFRRLLVGAGKGRKGWFLNGGIHDVLNAVLRIVDEIKKRKLIRKTERSDMGVCNSDRVRDVFDGLVGEGNIDWESVRLHHTSHHERETFTPCRLQMKLSNARGKVTTNEMER